MEADISPGEDHSKHGHGGAGHSMSMSFHFGTNEVILFDAWQVTTMAGMIGSCFAVLILGILFEMLKAFRSYLLRRDGGERGRERNVNGIEVDGPDGKIRVVSRRSVISHICDRAHLVQTLLHMLQFLLGYSLMLIFMTYNVWLAMATCLGIGLGFCLFGWYRAGSDQNADCCH